MNTYRRPAGHRPYLPPSTDHAHAGRWAGLCAVVLLAAMIFLSLHALARVACGPAAHPSPHLDILPASHQTNALLAAPSEQAGQAPPFFGEVDA